ncbi:MAG: Flp family type IVb pilin [Acidobacteria bacterium]|nr:Flp family type IVb pilin [Acidobacteriota bacterium]
MMKWMKLLWQDERGQDLTEYALLLVLMALAAVAFVPDLAQAVNDVFQAGASNLTGAIPPAVP